MHPFFSPEAGPDRAGALAEYLSDQTDFLTRSASRQMARIGENHVARTRAWFERCQSVLAGMQSGDPAEAFRSGLDYWRDVCERLVMTADVLRERADNDAAHLAAGTPPVLIYEHETVVDGHDLPQPVNYMLLKVLPPAGVEIKDWKRPYVIIDPRAGHGAGIGGFKADSQVGVALHDGHPVYFVAFRPHPEPGQTLADVTRAEAEFVRHVIRLHPDAPKPIVVGNCQGGWATMLLAATNPDLTGPLVINGAPLAYWSGRIGENPMRYNGGLLGGVVPAMLFSDLGHGEFDGAHLVSNFELLNPARNFFGKYFDLFRDVDDPEARARFLEFERWWGGYHFMNEEEIRWIVEQLFVGNRLSRGEARLEPGRRVDLKTIRSPIIVFASRGDNITPPQQALNWICDTYADEQEIKIRGQRIIYMVHDKVGHLGIFVSSSIARKEHTEVASTMKTIEALAPGLYEMVIEEQHGEGLHARFVVNFVERRMDDIRTLDDGPRTEEEAFAAVDRMSQLAGEAYDLWMRPFVQAAVPKKTAESLRDLHPSRVQRGVFASRNPAMTQVAAAAETVRANRRPLAPDHPLRAAEALAADAVEQSMDFARDVRDALYEWSFLALWANPAMRFAGRRFAYHRTRKDPHELRMLPEVQAHLLNIASGGLPEAVIRMLIILANTRGSVRRSRLERSAHVLTRSEPFASLGAERRAAIIHAQTVIVEFEPDRAVETLPLLLSDPGERSDAVTVVEFIAGALDEMEPPTIQALERFRRVLGLQPITLPENAPAAALAAPADPLSTAAE